MTHTVGMTQPATRPRLREAIAEEVQVLLVRRRRTAVSLAKELNWSQSYLAHRLTGRQPFDADDLEAIADALGVEVHDLLPERQGAGSGRSATRRYAELADLNMANPPILTPLPSQVRRRQAEQPPAYGPTPRALDYAPLQLGPVG